MNKFLTKLILILILITINASFSKGLKAKDFILPDENGNKVKLSDYKGNIVVLIFWATTCGSCKRELPEISVLQGEYENKPVKFFAIVIDTKDLEKIKRTKEKWGFDIPVLIGNTKLRLDYRVFGTPTTFVIDKNGRIRKMLIGGGKLDKLKKTIDKLLEE